MGGNRQNTASPQRVDVYPSGWDLGSFKWDLLCECAVGFRLRTDLKCCRMQKIAKEGKSALCLNSTGHNNCPLPLNAAYHPNRMARQAGSSMLEVSRWGAPSAENGIEAKDDYMRTGDCWEFQRRADPSHLSLQPWRPEAENRPESQTQVARKLLASGSSNQGSSRIGLGRIIRDSKPQTQSKAVYKGLLAAWLGVTWHAQFGEIGHTAAKAGSSIP